MAKTLRNMLKKTGKYLTFVHAGPYLTALSQALPSEDRVKALLGTGAAAGTAMALGVSGAATLPGALSGAFGLNRPRPPHDPLSQEFIGPRSMSQELTRVLMEPEQPSGGLTGLLGISAPQVTLPGLPRLSQLLDLNQQKGF